MVRYKRQDQEQSKQKRLNAPLLAIKKRQQQRNQKPTKRNKMENRKCISFLSKIERDNDV